jgi:hypothetical protein
MTRVELQALQTGAMWDIDVVVGDPDIGIYYEPMFRPQVAVPLQKLVQEIAFVRVTKPV